MASPYDLMDGKVLGVVGDLGWQGYSRHIVIRDLLQLFPGSLYVFTGPQVTAKAYALPSIIAFEQFSVPGPQAISGAFATRVTMNLQY